MSKRKPTSELNDRNWDQEEEPEEAGTFSSAAQDVLKNRVIRRAKRTLPTDSENRNSGSVFAGFALKTSDSSTPKPSLSTGVTLNFGSNLTFQPKTNGTKKESSDNGSKDSADNPQYLHQLKVLNENILSWIQKHVQENPYCILTPSFKDYEKHLGDLEKKYSVQNANNSQVRLPKAPPVTASIEKKEAPSIFGGSSKPMTGGFTFGQSPSSQSASSADRGASIKPLASGFTFGQSPASQSADSSDRGASSKPLASGFTFGQSPASQSADSSNLGASSKPPTGLFSFGQSSTKQPADTSGLGVGSKPFTSGFTFGQSSTSQSADSSDKPDSAGGTGLFGQSEKGSDTVTAQATGDDEEYQPPKVEVREIKEDGAVYTQRCKLFFQKDGQWTDKGVGNLHLKPADNGRTQLIVRADTNLGNILLNILLSSAMPTKRQGKNNVFFVCVPNPPTDPKNPSSDPVPMLLRVKSAEEADELLSKLEEMKA